MTPRLELVDVYEKRFIADHVLFQLLGQRTREQSISHRAMPTLQEHENFIESRPYLAWYLVYVYDNEDGPAHGIATVAGATYLSKQREIGIFIFESYQKRGYGSRAVQELMKRHPGKAYANVNPANAGSAEMFKKLGFELRQLTFAIGDR